MPQREIHECQCLRCRQSQWHPDQELHAGMNLLLSRLDEQQRRWYAALESQRIGHGGDRASCISPCNTSRCNALRLSACDGRRAASSHGEAVRSHT